MCTKSARESAQKGSLRVKEDAHSCQPEKKTIQKKRREKSEIHKKKSFFFFLVFFSQLTKSRRYSTESN
jgi:hypothetical protein